jgi:signal transduction histidine kinase
MRSDGDEEEERKRLLQIQGKEFVNEKQKSLFLVLSDISILQNIEEAKLQAKEMTVATVTHELRTPANSILSMLTLLKKPNLKRSDFLQFLKVAISSTMLLLNLINDIMVKHFK